MAPVHLAGALVWPVLGGVLFLLCVFVQGVMMHLFNPNQPVMGSEHGSYSSLAVDHREEREQERIAELSERHACRAEGFGEGVVPARALVRFPDKFDGRTRVVSFERAWGIVEGAEPGAVVAFCLR